MVYEGSKDIAGKKVSWISTSHECMLLAERCIGSAQSSIYLSDQEANEDRDAQRLHMYLSNATKLLKKPLKHAPDTNRPFFAGTHPSYADVAMFAALNVCAIAAAQLALRVTAHVL